MLKTRHLLSAIALCVSSSAVLADATISFKDPIPHQPAKVLVKDGIVLVEDQDGQSVALFDSKTDTVTSFQHAQKNYITMSEEKLSKQMSMLKQMQRRMQQQMQKRMEGMPEEQRKMMEQKMAMFGNAPGGSGQDGNGPATEIKKSGKTINVNGIQCEEVSVYNGSQKVSEACIADAKALGISQADYEALNAMFNFGERMAKSSGMGKMGSLFAHDGAGIPVRSKELLSGKGTEIRSVNSDSIDSKKFAIPEGYQALGMPGMPGMGQH